MTFDIQDNLTWIRLKSIAFLNGSFTSKSEKFTSACIRAIKISDFDENGIKDKDIKRYAYSKELDSYKIHNDDILLCMTGETVCKSVFVKNIVKILILIKEVP